MIKIEMCKNSGEKTHNFEKETGSEQPTHCTGTKVITSRNRM